MGPVNVGLYSRLGDLYRHTGQLQAAADQYRRALKLQPASAGLRKRLALTYAQQGAYEQALVQLKQIVAHAPGNPEGYYMAAAINARQLRRTEALFWLEEALKRGYRDWPAIMADTNLESIKNTAAFTELKNKYNAGN